MTVLILAPKRDVSANRMVRALGERGVRVFRADLGWFPQQLTLDAELRDGRWVGRLATPLRQVALQELRSVWYRSPSTFRFPAEMSGTERRHALHEAKLGVGGVLGALPVLWVNHPSRHADAGYKPRQLVAAARAGLSVVPTLVTNDPAAVRRFAARCRPEGVVTKMLGAPAICEQGGRRVALTERLSPSHLADLRGVEISAHQFQRWASKREEARVIAIGEQVFAVVIRAGSATAYVDWRADYEALSYTRVDPPAEVQRGIRAVMADLGLVLRRVRLRDRPGRDLDLPGGQCGRPVWVRRRPGRGAVNRSLGRPAHGRSTVNDWAARAAALADELVEQGKLRSGEWIAAVRAVPRHVLVPAFFEQDPATGQWLRRDGTDPGYPGRVNANRALFTVIGEESGSWGTAVVGVSSTSTPGLMTRMLEALDIRDGHHVLEIGTGTGYNAALLTHRLGENHVFSVDIEVDLVGAARDRLAALGYRPTLVAADGANGLPEHAPYDRIIATCSVPAIPWTWVEQTRVGGLILTDLKLSIHAGNLILLHRHPDRAEGRFDPTWAGFMPLRPATARSVGTLPVRDRDRATRRGTDLDQLRPWDNMVAWFLTQLSVPTEIGYGHCLDEHTGHPGDVFLTSPDGSWCEVSADSGQVWEGGPTPLWAAVENAHHRWHDLGEPGWDRFGLTVAPDRQWVWLDTPDSDHRWPLRPCRRRVVSA